MRRPAASCVASRTTDRTHLARCNTPSPAERSPRATAEFNITIGVDFYNYLVSQRQRPPATDPRALLEALLRPCLRRLYKDKCQCVFFACNGRTHRHRRGRGRRFALCGARAKHVGTGRERRDRAGRGLGAELRRRYDRQVRHHHLRRRHPHRRHPHRRRDLGRSCRSGLGGAHRRGDRGGRGPRQRPDPDRPGPVRSGRVQRLHPGRPAPRRHRSGRRQLAGRGRRRRRRRSLRRLAPWRGQARHVANRSRVPGRNRDPQGAVAEVRRQQRLPPPRRVGPGAAKQASSATCRRRCAAPSLR